MDQEWSRRYFESSIGSAAAFLKRTIIFDDESAGMKTVPMIALALATAFSIATAEEKKSDKSLGERTIETLKKGGEKTKEAGRNVAKATKKATETVVDTVTPDKDARQVEVTLTGRQIDVPKNLESGKTAFVVRNADTAKHNFEIQGEGIEKKFFTGIAPDETKVLHVHLKPGIYKVFYRGKGEAAHGKASELIVR
jgi:hypothetical protein